jgi:hypothetical protein
VCALACPSRVLPFLLADSPLCALVCSPFSSQTTHPRVPSPAPARSLPFLLSSQPSCALACSCSQPPFSFLLLSPSPPTLSPLLADYGVWPSAHYRKRSGYGCGRICAIHKWSGVLRFCLNEFWCCFFLFVNLNILYNI